MLRKRIGTLFLATILATVALSGCVVVPARGLWPGGGGPGFHHAGPPPGGPHGGYPYGR